MLSRVSFHPDKSQHRGRLLHSFVANITKSSLSLTNDVSVGTTSSLAEQKQGKMSPRFPENGVVETKTFTFTPFPFLFCTNKP